MNIVRLVHHFPCREEIAYGLQSTFYHLSIQQARLGLNLHVICKRSPQQKKFEEIEGMNIHRVVAPYSISSLYKLLGLKKEIRIDIIHTHATSGLSYTLLKKLLRKKMANAIHVAHVHGTTKGILHAWSKLPQDIINKEGMRRRIEGYPSIIRETVVWKNANAIITNSKFLKEELINIYGIPTERIHVVYNGVDLQTFHWKNSRKAILEKHGIDSRFKVILYLGGFRPVKGPFYLIRAVERIINELKDVKVLFVGGKSPQEKYFTTTILQMTEKLREKGAVHLIENIPHFQLADYYSAADAIIVPSVYDAFPKVILEAMACETLVVASAAGGIPELIKHKKTGLLVEPANPDELAEAITLIVSDSDLRNKISSNAKKMVKERFTWEHIAKNTLRVYNKLLG